MKHANRDNVRGKALRELEDIQAERVVRHRKVYMRYCFRVSFLEGDYTFNYLISIILANGTQKQIHISSIKTSNSILFATWRSKLLRKLEMHLYESGEKVC